MHFKNDGNSSTFMVKILGGFFAVVLLTIWELQVAEAWLPRFFQCKVWYHEISLGLTHDREQHDKASDSFHWWGIRGADFLVVILMSQSCSKKAFRNEIFSDVITLHCPTDNVPNWRFSVFLDPSSHLTVARVSVVHVVVNHEHETTAHAVRQHRFHFICSLVVLCCVRHLPFAVYSKAPGVSSITVLDTSRVTLYYAKAPGK